MSEGDVIFKASVDGLILVLREEEDFEAVFKQIEKKLASAGRFFKGASISVKYRGRKLNEDEESRILKLLVSKTGADIKSFGECETEPPKMQTENQVESLGRMKIKKQLYFKGINEGDTKFYRGTVRSGQLVSYNGNIVVLGDVNPGGEVEAAGNVVVMGALRGIVHAGADGNKEAIVVAYNLQPMQLRIADVITRSPDEKSGNSIPIPELAYVKEDMVYIERFLPNTKQGV
ncbi:MAG: septum site-determining protein MinC [Acetivibrionales bacterium]|jgi:septum site-determining protein MinC